MFFNRKNTAKLALTAVLSTAVLPCFGQANVVDSRPSVKTSSQSSASAASKMNSEMFLRMQQLEQEVLDLRGMVEQQAFEIRRLKQQRLDDYTDLDQRISSLLNQSGGNSLSTSTRTTTAKRTSSAAPLAKQKDKPISERELYSEALNLLLQKKDFDGSSAKLDQYLKIFPNGLYAPNAFYWLGEISLSKQQLPQSKDWFSKLLAEYPGHNKAPDAKFKLGKLYYQMGDKSNARSMLNDVAKGNTPAAQLAKDFIVVNGL